MSQQPYGSLILPALILIAAIISIQFGASLAMEYLYDDVGIEGIVTLRLLISSIILTLLLRPWRLKLKEGNWKALILYGIALGTMNFLLFKAFERIPQGMAVALEFTGPLVVTMFASRRLIDFIWVGLVVIGLLLLVPFTLDSDLDMIGVLYALGAGVCWAIYIIFGKRAGYYYGANTVTFGSIIALIIYLPIGIQTQGFTMFAPSLLPIAIVIAILSSVIPYVFEIYALSRMPTKTFGTLTSTEPVIGAISAMIILGQFLSFSEWMGMMAIIIASIGATLTGNSGSSFSDNIPKKS